MLSVGLDFHKYFSYVTVMDEQERILEKLLAVPNPTAGIISPEDGMAFMSWPS